MNLKKLFTPQRDTPQQEYYLALEIHESLVKTAVWTLEQEKPVISTLGSFELWDNKESLVNGIDASLSSATKDLSTQPRKAILGLPEPWLDGDKIHPSKTSLIKYVIKELDLKPIGLVTTTQAIIHYLKDKEGIPPSAILLEVYPDKVTIAVIKLGKIKAIEEVGRSGELSSDVQEGLTRLNLDQLPPRFILSNGSDLENEQQQLISYPWQENLSFLHLPKVEVLPTEFSIEAIALSGGKEAVKLLKGAVAAPASNQPPAKKVSKTSLADIGFSTEDSSPPPPPKAKPVAKITAKPKPKLPFRFNKISFKKPKPMLLIAIFLFFPVLFSILFFKLATASIIVTVQEKVFSQTVPVSFGRELDQTKIILPINIQTLSASVSQSGPTTGESLVGEKAGGSISLVNSTSKPILIKSGTAIDSGNLRFVINSNVNVASASANIDENGVPQGLNYGQAKDVVVKALKIGSQYNLDKGTQFSVANYSRKVIFAVAQNDFSGGTSRTVKAVSGDDQKKLLKQASQEVISQINSKLKEQNTDISSLMLSDITYTQKKYDKDIGEEADVFKLDLSGQVKMLVYSKNTILEQFTAKQLPNINPGVSLLADKTKIKLSSPTKENEQLYSAQAEISGLLVPTIDKDRLKAQLKGKAVNRLKNILETIPGYKGTKVIIKPKIPLLSGYLPLDPAHISFKVTTSN